MSISSNSSTSMNMSMSRAMGMGMSVRMRTACSMHSIARNSTCRAWHGSRAQHDHSIENANATGGLRAKHKEARTTETHGTKMHKMHACAQAIHNSNAGQRATATQPVSQSVSHRKSVIKGGGRGVRV